MIKMVKATTLLTDVFAIIILIIGFSQSYGIIGPVAQTLVKSHTFATVIHYQTMDTYKDTGLSYYSKIPIPAGYKLILYDSSYPNALYKGKAYLKAAGNSSATQKEIGVFDHSGNSLNEVYGPGWMIVKTTVSGYVVIDYHSGTDASKLMPTGQNTMPFQDTLVGYGNALSDLVTNLY